MLIYVKIIKKKTFYGRTDRRTTQNYSSEPHKKKSFLPDRQTDTRSTQNYSSEPHKKKYEIKKKSGLCSFKV